MLLYVFLVSSVNNDTPPGVEAVFVKSAILPVSSSTLPIYSSVSSSKPLIRIEMVLNAVPVVSAFLVICTAALSRAMVSFNELFAADIAAEERSSI